MRVILALAFALAACGADAQDLGDSTMLNHDMSSHSIGSGFSGRSAQQSSTTLIDWNPSTASSTMPSLEACSTANSCVLDCVGGAGPWNCVDGSGAAVAVTQGSGADSVSTPWGLALKAVTAAKAPRLTTPAAFESFWTAPHTVVAFAYATTVTSGVPFQVDQAASTKGFQMRMNDDGCEWYCSACTPTSIKTNIADGGLAQNSQGWQVSSCKKTGAGAASVYTTRVNGVGATSGSWPNDPEAPTGTPFMFARNQGGSAPLDGPMQRVRLYNAAISDARIDALAAAYQSLVATDGTVLDHATGRQVFYVDGNGNAWPYGNSLGNATSAGVPIEERNDSEVGGAGNNWATDGLDANSWADVATPTITQNTAAGPFFTWKNTNEADTIDDNDAAAFEGKSANNSCDNAVDHNTSSCWLKAGTSTKARIDWVCTGAGCTATPSSCDFTLTSSFARYACPTVTSGTITTLKGRLLVGNAASDTGTILVSQCQCDRQPRAQLGLMATATGTGRDVYHVPAAETATWQTAGFKDSGSVSIVFTLNHNVPGDEIDDAHDAWFLVDMSGNGDTEHRMVVAYEVLGSVDHQVIFRLEDGSGNAAITDLLSSANITFTRDTQYVMRAKWSSCDATHTHRFLYLDTCTDPSTCVATTLIASDQTCTKTKIEADTWGRMWIGNRFSNTFGLNGRVARVLVTTP